MLQALREIRADGQQQKKKQDESNSSVLKPLLGPVLGPQIAADANPVSSLDESTLPPNLEYVGLELELPVGFRRLRWAFLHSESPFISEALFVSEAKYENVVIGQWSKHDDCIGDPVDPECNIVEDFVGAEKEAEYLMPKSAFVSANMCYETQYIVAYNDNFFCLKKRGKLWAR